MEPRDAWIDADFVNIRGDRMAWDTLNQPPVVVKEGQTTTYDMLITPPVPPAEKP